MADRGNLLLDEQASKVFSHLLGRIVHDFNNPLAAIIGFADLLRQPDVGEEKRERYVARIYEQAVKLSQLVETISQLGAGPEVRCGATSLSRTVAEIVALRAKGLEAAGIVLLVDERCGEALQVMADRAATGRILHALLNNAEQLFKEHPLVTDKRVALRCFPSGNSALVEIEDSGPGVAPENIDRLFDAFFTTRRSGGLGVGLTIARRLAGEMGGTLELATASGGELGGACFRLTLPVAAPR